MIVSVDYQHFKIKHCLNTNLELRPDQSLNSQQLKSQSVNIILLKAANQQAKPI